MNGKSPVEHAYDLARTGEFESFTEVKRALRRLFNVERELVGRTLAASITTVCRAAQAAHKNDEEAAVTAEAGPR